MAKNTNTDTFVKDSVKQTEDAVNATKAQIESVVKSSQEAATKQYEQAAELARQQVEQVSDVASRGYSDVISLNKDNVEAVVRASTIAGERFETVGRELVSFAQKQMDNHVENTRKLFAAKNPQEFFALQSSIIRENFDAVVAESRKVGELSTQAANDAFEPIQSQAKTAFEKAVKPAA